jgi:hypothetical protein
MPPKVILTQADCDKKNKVYKPSTNRCVKKCGPRQIRDPESFKCKKPEAKPKGNSQESCNEVGKFFNPTTRRCVKKCGPRQVRDLESFKCKKTTATTTRKARKPTKAKTPEPQSILFDNYQPPGVRSPLYNKMSPEYSPQPNEPLRLGYNFAKTRPKIEPPSPINKSLREEITTEEIDKTQSLVKFVKNHPAKINEKKIEDRMKHIQQELRLKIKDLTPAEVEKLEQTQKKISNEIEKLENLMAENVANNVIIEKQADVAEKIDELKNKVEQLTTNWPSPSIDDLSPSSPPFHGIFTKKSRRPQPYQKFSSARKPKQPLLLKYNKPKYNKMSPEYSPQPKQLLMIEDKKPEIRGRTRRASPEADIFSSTEAWRNDENKVKGSKQSPTQTRGRTGTASPDSDMFLSAEAWRDDENKVKGSKQSPMQTRGRTRRKSDTPTPSPSWDVEFGNKGLPKAQEKHKGHSPGWSNSPTPSPAESPEVGMFDFFKGIPKLF